LDKSFIFKKHRRNKVIFVAKQKPEETKKKQAYYSKGEKKAKEVKK
jgi:ribosomal protein L30E